MCIYIIERWWEIASEWGERKKRMMKGWRWDGRGVKRCESGSSRKKSFWDEAAQKSSFSWDFLLCLSVFFSLSPLSHHSFHGLSVTSFPPIPFSSRGGINFNDWFVADPEDRWERAEHIHSPFSIFSSLTLKYGSTRWLGFISFLGVLVHPLCI